MARFRANVLLGAIIDLIVTLALAQLRLLPGHLVSF
jgi:hypothetical protein